MRTRKEYMETKRQISLLMVIATLIAALFYKPMTELVTSASYEGAYVAYLMLKYMVLALPLLPLFTLVDLNKNKEYKKFQRK